MKCQHHHCFALTAIEEILFTPHTFNEFSTVFVYQIDLQGVGWPRAIVDIQKVTSNESELKTMCLHSH